MRDNKPYLSVRRLRNHPGAPPADGGWGLSLLLTRMSYDTLYLLSASCFVWLLPMRNDCSAMYHVKFGRREARPICQVTHDSLVRIEFLIQADVALLIHSEWHIGSLSIAFSWSMTVDVSCQRMPWLIRECKMTIIDLELSPLVILPNQCLFVSCRMPDSSGVSPHDGRLLCFSGPLSREQVIVLTSCSRAKSVWKAETHK